MKFSIKDVSSVNVTESAVSSFKLLMENFIISTVSSTANKFGKKEVVVIAGDVNVYFGRSAEFYEDQHGGYGF